MWVCRRGFLKRFKEHIPTITSLQQDLDVLNIYLKLMKPKSADTNMKEIH